MQTVTIQIGNTDDKLTQAEWSAYVADVKSVLLEEFVREVHFFGGSPNWTPWQNAAFVVVCDCEKLEQMKGTLRIIRERYNQDSIAWTEGETEFI